MFDPVQWFVNIPHEWAVFFLSMIPLTELRASIPIGIEVYKMPWWQVWWIAVAGDFIPAVFILLLMPVIHGWLVKRRILGELLTKKLNHAERVFSGKYSKYGVIALIIFVGIPLPFTGSWTGSLAAFIFNIPFKKSWPLILAGVCMAAMLVTLITLFTGGTLRWLF